MIDQERSPHRDWAAILAALVPALAMVAFPLSRGLRSGLRAGMVEKGLEEGFRRNPKGSTRITQRDPYGNPLEKSMDLFNWIVANRTQRGLPASTITSMSPDMVRDTAINPMLMDRQIMQELVTDPETLKRLQAYPRHLRMALDPNREPREDELSALWELFSGRRS